MIPKIIHYCWFGRGEKPALALKCIESWKKYLPDYEIKEWNEDNFDVNIIPYTKEAYQAKKYAFVSDYARIWILYKYGGIYFDTDVEVIKLMGDILQKGAFMGCEINGGNNQIAINPGLGIATNPNNPVYAEILNIYSGLNFYKNDGSVNLYAIVRITTDVLKNHGLKDCAEIQNVNNIIIYPAEYFNPLDSLTGRLTCTQNTYTIHWYMNSWGTTFERLKLKIGRFVRRCINRYK